MKKTNKLTILTEVELGKPIGHHSFAVMRIVLRLTEEKKRVGCPRLTRISPRIKKPIMEIRTISVHPASSDQKQVNKEIVVRQLKGLSQKNRTEN